MVLWYVAMAIVPITALRSSRVTSGSAVPVGAIGEIVEVHDAHLECGGIFVDRRSVLWVAGENAR